MGLASLIDLHQQFISSLTPNTYLSYQKEGTAKLKLSQEKTIHLNEVFQHAQELIQATFNQSDEREAQIAQLRKLEKAGDDLYTQRYVQSTQNSWLRWFLKGVAKYTPSKLKVFLPRFFSNSYAKAEEETRQAHEDYKNLLTTRIAYLEEQIKKDEQLIRNYLKDIQKEVQKLNQFDEQTLSLQQYKSALKTITETLHTLAKTFPKLDQANILQATGLTETTFNLFQEQYESLISTLNTENYQALRVILQPIAWGAALTQALECVVFGVQRMLNQHIPQVTNEQGQRLRENALYDYRGSIKIMQTEDPLIVMKELHTLVQKQPKCRPGAIEIALSNEQHLTPEFFSLLYALKEKVPEIRLKGLKTLDCRTLAPSKEEARQLMLNYLGTFKLNEVETLILNDHTLNLVPSLKELLPALSTIDFRDCQLVTDQTLSDWIQRGYLSSIHSLKLERTALTTDSLTHLMELPCLAQLTLPDLPQGRLPLNQLPKLGNPFRVKLFYTASQATRPLACELYTGPLIWATVFQIPAVRAGNPEATQLFSEKHTTLDPTSVAYWLHKDEYLLLGRQTAVRTILADFNAKLNDTNLVEFVQKFPNAKTISLYGCPYITNKGIEDLLGACPEIESLDLTACPGIKPDISKFFPEKNIIIKQKVLKIENAQLTHENALEEFLAKKELHELSTIDLTGCTNLTDEMLGKLLARLNAPIWLDNGQKRKNPQRLNLAFLNLTGCTKITVKAFDNGQGENGKRDYKLLESLSHIVIKDCPHLKVKWLQDLYPNVTFPEKHEPFTLFIDPNIALKKLANGPVLPSHHIVNYRITVELFSADCEDHTLTRTALHKPVDTAQLTSCDFKISLRKYDDATPFTFSIHRGTLYSHSLFFRDAFRPGGWSWGNREAAYTMTNAHATQESAQLMRDLLSGHVQIERLPWRQAADLAELCGPRIFNVPHFYQQLLQHIHQQFNIDAFDDMLTIAFMLEDEEGLNQYEALLRALVEGIEQDADLMDSITIKISAIEAMRARISENAFLEEADL